MVHKLFTIINTAIEVGAMIKGTLIPAAEADVNGMQVFIYVNWD